LVLTISEDDRRAFLQAAPELRTGRMPMITTAGAGRWLVRVARGAVYARSFQPRSFHRSATIFRALDAWEKESVHPSVTAQRVAIADDGAYV
jgi:hypothetical protein